MAQPSAVEASPVAIATSAAPAAAVTRPSATSSGGGSWWNALFGNSMANATTAPWLDTIDRLAGRALQFVQQDAARALSTAKIKADRDVAIAEARLGYGTGYYSRGGAAGAPIDWGKILLYGGGALVVLAIVSKMGKR